MDGVNRHREHSASLALKAGYGVPLQSKDRRSIFTKYALFHLASFFLLSIVPIYIMTTGIPSTLCNMLGSSWSTLVTNRDSTTTPPSSAAVTDASSLRSSTKRLNLFATYIYFCFTVTLIHFSSFVQLSSLFKNLLVLIFALTFSLTSFFGICPTFNITNQVRILGIENK